VCVLSLPWLMPCVGLISGSALSLAHDAVPRSGEAADLDPRLKNWAAKPGPALRVVDHRSVEARLLVTDAELSVGGASVVKPSGTGLGRGTAGAVEKVAASLMLVDPVTWIAAANGAGSGFVQTSPHGRRRQLTLCDSPFVLLQGDDIRAIHDKSGQLLLARASRARVTIITPDGSFFALAARVHFRAGLAEVILEGNGTVQSGHQHIKAVKSGALIKLNFVTRIVTISDAVNETRF
jgi:hypothetical protein